MISALLLAGVLASGEANYSDGQACVVWTEDYALAMSYSEDEPADVDDAVCSEYRVYVDCAAPDRQDDPSGFGVGCTNLDYSGR